MTGRITALILLFLSFCVNATEDFEGRYTRLPESLLEDPLVATTDTEERITVLEFFSYGCPACNSVAPMLREWEKNLDKQVHFVRVPVEFARGWDTYARAFYTAEMLGKLKEFDERLFDAIHQERMNLSTDAAMRQFFLDNGVSAGEYDKTVNSFAVDRSVWRAKMLMRVYKVFAVPSVIVDNKFMTDLEKAKGRKEFVEVIDHLIEKVKQS